MIIKYDTHGFEDLSEFKYIYKRDVFRRKNVYYKYVSSCKECGFPFFMRLSYPTIFCSKVCSSNSETTKSKISKSLSGHKRSKHERCLISKRMSKGGVVKKNIPLFSTYAKQLKGVEEVRSNKGLLEVRCTKCNNWFIPKRTNVEQRAQYIKGNVDRENRFYCSDSCKNLCSIFNKHKYPSGFNPRKYRNNNIILTKELSVWSKEVLCRAKHKCEICGKPAKHAHHIQPKKLEPIFSLDPDNGIAVCVECHYKYGHQDECSPINLARVVCE